MATWKTSLLQDSVSPSMEQLSFSHDHTLVILLMITVLVGHLMMSLVFNILSYR